MDKKSKFQDLIDEASAKTGLPANLLASVIQRESSGNPQAVSPAGAQGLMQLMPGTAKELGVSDPFDPRQNIMGGSQYLKQQMDAFGGDPTMALAAYNAGPGNVRKYGGIPPFEETQNYVKSIMDSIGQVGAFGNIPQGAQLPQQQAEVSPLQPQQDMSAIEKMFGLDPKSRRKAKLAEIVDALGSGLASVSGAFNESSGRQLQQMYSQGYDQRSAQRKAQLEKSRGELSKFLNPKRPQSVQEYEYAKSQGFKGSFEDFKNMGRSPMQQMIDMMGLQLKQKQLEGLERQGAKEALGKQLPASQTTLLAEGMQIPSLLNSLEESLKSTKASRGPLMGKLMSYNPYATETQDLQSQLKIATQMVGRFMEKGVLRKEDEIKYAKMLPQLTDTIEVQHRKLKNVSKVLAQAYNSYLDSYKRSGFDVSGYEKMDVPEEEKKKPSMSQTRKAEQKTGSGVSEAEKWARDNPNDPRAKQILQMIGA